MHRRAIAFFLAVAMAWMGLSAQEQLTEACSESLSEWVVAQAVAPATKTPAGSLDDHHLDNLPFQVLVDLVGLLGPGEALVASGLGPRPATAAPRGARPPHLARLQRPPIARA